MTDADVEIYRTLITNLARKWIPLLQLESWKIEFILTRSHLREKDGGMGWPTMAETSSHYAYKQAAIEWFLPALEDEDDDSIEQSFVHELAHIVLEEMHYWTLDHTHEESVATHLARAFLAVAHLHFLTDAEVEEIAVRWESALQSLL